MFIDELKAKFPDELITDFSVTLFGDSLFVAAGVKSVAYLSETEIRLRVKNRTAVVSGAGLTLAEVGGTEIAVKGKIASVSFAE